MLDSNNRESGVDVLKGIAIVLVVLGHVIQYNTNDYLENSLWRFIYSFHMPLFFAISGYLIHKKSNIDHMWILKRFKRLMVPFIFWTIVKLISSDNKKEFAMAVLKNPDNSLWFLLVLFEINMIWFVSRKTIKNDKYLIVGRLIIVAVINVVNLLLNQGNGWFGIPLVAEHIVYFYTGYLFGNIINNITITKKVKILVPSLCFIIYLFLWSIYDWDKYPAISIIDATNVNRIIRYLVNRGYLACLALLGIILFATLADYLNRFKYTANILKRISYFSLEIYAIQWYFLELVHLSNLPIQIMINCIITIIFSIVLAKLLEGTLLGKLMFGW